MRLDPQIKIFTLLRAIPSSSAVFEKFGIDLDRSAAKSLQEMCADRNIRFEEFLRAMDEIDWSVELSRADTDGFGSWSQDAMPVVKQYWGTD